MKEKQTFLHIISDAFTYWSIYKTYSKIWSIVTKHMKGKSYIPVKQTTKVIVRLPQGEQKKKQLYHGCPKIIIISIFFPPF